MLMKVCMIDFGRCAMLYGSANYLWVFDLVGELHRMVPRDHDSDKTVQAPSIFLLNGFGAIEFAYDEPE